MMNRLRTILEKYIAKTKQMIDDTLYRDKAKSSPEDFTRTRKMPFEWIIQFILTPRNNSTQNALENFFDKIGETYI